MPELNPQRISVLRVGTFQVDEVITRGLHQIFMETNPGRHRGGVDRSKTHGRNIPNEKKAVLPHGAGLDPFFINDLSQWRPGDTADDTERILLHLHN